MELGGPKRGAAEWVGAVAKPGGAGRRAERAGDEEEEELGAEYEGARCDGEAGVGGGKDDEDEVEEADEGGGPWKDENGAGNTPAVAGGGG